MRPKGAVSAGFGVVLILAGILGVGLPGNIWNYLIIGGIVAALGFTMGRAQVRGIITGILGIWLIISAFIPGLELGAGAEWNDIVVGALLALLGFSTRQLEAKAEVESGPNIRKAA